MADCALYLTAPLAALRVFPDVRAHLTGAVYAGYLVPIVYGAIKYRRLTSYHTIGARVAGVLLSVAAFLVLLTGVGWPFYVATAVLLGAHCEHGRRLSGPGCPARARFASGCTRRRRKGAIAA
jgi:CDP-diacylglycerol--glycerol-3-phosphate 3-phosphatidyltransferase